MNAEDKKALIERLNKLAESLKWHNVGYAQDVLKAVDALNAQPVKLPRKEKALIGRDYLYVYCAGPVESAIRAAGYEVQE